ncbi:hypothetical protein Hanom_Chr04g00365271 [Helianthus anomalus]
MWRLRGYSVTQLGIPHNCNIITIDLPLLQPIPLSVFLVPIISLHPKEEPDHTDNYVELYGIISDWILNCIVCYNRYVLMFSFMYKQN